MTGSDHLRCRRTKRICWTGIILVVTACFALPELTPQLAASLPAAAQEKTSRKKKKEAEPYALLFGTVFDQNGRLVRDADIEVREKDGKRKWHAVSDIQGEFAVHLPVAAAVYIVEATGTGLSPDKKEVSISGDERQDVVLHVTRGKPGQ